MIYQSVTYAPRLRHTMGTFFTSDSTKDSGVMQHVHRAVLISDIKSVLLSILQTMEQRIKQL